MTDLVVLHTRYCLRDDRSAEVWAPYEAVDASLRRHVVVVDADREARQALRSLIERAGHRVDEAEDARGAVELALAGQPDVVLVDVDLPGRDGGGVAARIRAPRGRQAPLLVALTRGGRAEDRRRARRRLRHVPGRAGRHCRDRAPGRRGASHDPPPRLTLGVHLHRVAFGSHQRRCRSWERSCRG